MGKKKKFLAQEYTSATNGKGLQEGTRIGRFFYGFAITSSVLGILFAIGVIAFTFIFFLSPVQGTSMMTTLNATSKDTDSVIVNRYGNANRGDIIIVRFYYTNPTEYEKSKCDQDEKGYYQYIIKRLIALPGDTVSVGRELKSTAVPNYAGKYRDEDYNYWIILNGERLDESYLKSTEVAHPSSQNFIVLYNVTINRVFQAEWPVALRTCVADGVLTVPDGYWFFMGDNRGGSVIKYNKSWDCASFGPQPVENFEGKETAILTNNETVTQYFWAKVRYYVLFGWAFGYGQA